MKATVVGGGMITADLILPSLYHLQRMGLISDIAICALGPRPLIALDSDPELKLSFPGQSFTPWPVLEADEKTADPFLYKKAIEKLEPHQLVVVAVPDHLHHSVIMTALERDQHVLCVKPLVKSGCYA